MIKRPAGCMAKWPTDWKWI